MVRTPDLALVDERPRTRGDCEPGGRAFYRPCPFVGCRHHLAGAEVARDGKLRVAGEELALEAPVERVAAATERAADRVVAMRESCILDVVDRNGEATLQQIGSILRLTRERIRQIERKGIQRGGPSARRLIRSLDGGETRDAGIDAHAIAARAQEP